MAYVDERALCWQKEENASHLHNNRIVCFIYVQISEMLLIPFFWEGIIAPVSVIIRSE